MSEPLVSAFVTVLAALEQARIDPESLDFADRVVEDVFATLSVMDAQDVETTREELTRLRATTSARYRLDTIDLIFRSLPG